MCKTLSKPKLQPLSLAFKSFLNSLASSFGKICLKVQIQDQAMHINFHVAHKDQVSLTVVLFWQWMGAKNC